MPLWQGLRCAIALNNMGCLMLERSCHQQAQETFQDALHLMKELASFEPGTPLSEHDCDTLLRSVQSKLQQADLCFSRPTPSSFDLSYESLSYCVLLPGLQAFLNENHALRFRPLRIEVTRAEELKMISDEVTSCILLLNFAVATAGASRIEFLQSQRAGLDPKRLPRIDNVLRILTLVNLLVERCDDNSNQALFLLLHALDTTTRALLDAGKVEEAEAVRSRMGTLKTYVQSNLSFLFTREPAAKAA
jgi:hypothetical protein